MTQKKLVTKSKFALMAGVSAAAITKTCKSNLEPAMVGKRIDASHPLAVAYLELHSYIKATKKHCGHKAAKNEAALSKLQTESYAEMTLHEVVEKFGTDPGFSEWTKAAKMIEIINEKRLKNAATRDELVSRTLVKTGVIDPINIVFHKLLSDGAKSITVKVTTMTKAGRSLKGCESMVIDRIASFIRPAKVNMIRNLKNDCDDNKVSRS